MPRKGKPGRTRGKGKKPKKLYCPPEKLVNPEPGGGNPPLNSNVVSGARALECCEENASADQKLLDSVQAIFTQLRDQTKASFNYNEKVDRVVEILFGNPFDKLAQTGRNFAESPITTVTEFQKGFPKAVTTNTPTPGVPSIRTGLIALSVPAFQYLYTLYDSTTQEAYGNALTQTLEMLKLMKSVRKKTKTNTCFECIKAALLRQSKHKKITLEQPPKTDA